MKNSIVNFLHSAFDRTTSRIVIEGELVKMVVVRATIIRLMPLYVRGLIQAYHL